MQRQGQPVALATWGADILAECAPLAAALDAAHATDAYSAALQAAQARLAQPESTPSARVLQEMAAQGNSFNAFALQQSVRARDALLQQPWPAVQQQHFEALARESIAAQKAIEAADTLAFEDWRQRYVAVEELG